MRETEPINRYTAKFVNEDLERSFEQYWSALFVSKDRVMLYVALFIYSLYVFLDVFTLTDGIRNHILILRAFMCVSAFGVIYSTYTKLGTKYFQLISCFTMLIAGVSVCVMITMIGEITPPYYIGLIMTAMIMTNLIRITFPRSLFLHGTLYVGFVIATSGFPTSTGIIAAHLFLVNSFLLSSISNYFLELRRRQEYLQYEENQEYSARLRTLVDEANRSLKRKNAVLNTLTHVFKTPLHQIIGYAQIIEQESLGPHSVPEYKEFSASVHNAGKNLLRLVQRILTYSRLDADIQHLNRQKTTTNEIIDCALSRLTDQIEEKKITIDMPETQLRLKVDGALLEQAYFELLANAVEASPPESRISLTARENEDGQIVMSISDSGKGLDLALVEEMKNTLERKESFLSVSDKFSLGITLANKIVQTHGGNVEFSHAADGGTVATIVLPATPEETATKIAAETGQGEHAMKKAS